MNRQITSKKEEALSKRNVIGAEISLRSNLYLVK